MYHYYVRYSLFIGKRKVGDGDMEVSTKRKISKMSDIKMVKEEISRVLKEEQNVTVDAILLDFYHLLRKGRY